MPFFYRFYILLIINFINFININLRKNVNNNLIKNDKIFQVLKTEKLTWF